MREILFRGKRVDSGEWVYGYLFNPKLLPDRYFILTGDIDIDTGTPMFAEVIPETFGQYTWLYDKNGVKIFDGDVIEYYFFDRTKRGGELITVKNVKTMLIEWYDASYHMKELFRNYRLDDEMRIITETVYDYRGDTKQGVYKSSATRFAEVIGNIHDNPELMEV